MVKRKTKRRTVGRKKPQMITVKGIKMTRRKYIAFVRYLNERRVQRFTKSDVTRFIMTWSPSGFR